MNESRLPESKVATVPIGSETSTTIANWPKPDIGQASSEQNPQLNRQNLQKQPTQALAVMMIARRGTCLIP
jgi:hypothetical protein